MQCLIGFVLGIFVTTGTLGVLALMGAARLNEDGETIERVRRGPWAMHHQGIAPNEAQAVSSVVADHGRVDA